MTVAKKEKHYLKKMAALCCICAMLLSIGSSYRDACAAETQISDTQAMEIVKKSFEKLKTHKRIAMVEEIPESWNYYAFDTLSQIGACRLNISVYEESYKHNLAEDTKSDWMDLKNGISYETNYDDKENLFYSYLPLSEDEIEYYRDTTFSNLEMILTKGFITAETYRFIGQMWDLGPDGVPRLCNIFKVPENDPSLFKISELIIPRYVYVGVDDGELYRIDEERFQMSLMESDTTNYYNHFCYPEPIASVPDYIADGAVLSSEYPIISKGMVYGLFDYKDHHDALHICGFSETSKASQRKNLKFPSSVKVLGTSYRVLQILECAFYREKEIRTVTIPNTVRKIEDKVFYGCSNLHTVKIGKGLKEIGKGVFKGCKKLKKIVIKNKKMKAYFKSAKGRKALGISKKVRIR